MLDKLDIRFRFLTVLLICILAVSGTYTALGLYADGSYDLLHILKLGKFWNISNSRTFVELVTQMPLLLLLKMHVHDLTILIRMYSFGLTCIPLGFWLAALFLQIKTDLFWLFIAAFSVCYLTCGICAISEANLTYSLVAFSASVLLKKRINIFTGTALIIAALIITRSYESMILLGPLLCGIALFRLRTAQKNDTSYIKIILIIASCLFAVSTVVAFISIISRTNFDGSTNISPLTTMHFIYLISMGCLMLMTQFFKQSKIRIVALILASILSFLYLFNPEFWSTPVMHFYFRVFSGAMLFAVILFTALFFYFSPKIRSSSAAVSLLLFTALIIPFYVQLIGFYQWGSVFEQTVLTNTGLLPIEKTKMAEAPYQKYNWSWSNPSLSLLLRGNQPGAIITNNKLYNGWQPFDPSTADNLLSTFKKDSLLYHFGISHSK